MSGLINILLVICLLLLPARNVSGADFLPREIYQRFSPAVLLIVATKDGGGGSAGTGSIISRDGLVITNAHVIFDKKANKIFPQINVFFKPDRVTGDSKNDLSRRSSVKVLALSNQLDLALLRIEDLPKGLSVIEFANPDEINIGEPMVAIGHPEQGGLWTLTTGVISANISDFQGIKGKDVFQTETSVNRGNSGGPLLDRRGYMAGINSNIARAGEGGLAITGVNFALKSGVAKKWLAGEGYYVEYGTLSLDITTGEKLEIQKDEPKTSGKGNGPGDKKTGHQEKIPDIGDPTVKSGRQKEEILSEKRPYDLDKLIRSVEEEMEDLMDEMRGKFRGNPQK
ncbi:MAG: trypsin-like peptidase domain-containing protein [Nitrospirota bacterium]